MKAFDEWWIENRGRRYWYDSDKVVWKAALEWVLTYQQPVTEVKYESESPCYMVSTDIIEEELGEE